MDKKIAGLIGAVSALASLDAAHAAVPAQSPDATHVLDVMRVASYDDLLKPIPNAVPLLKASDAMLAEQAASDNQAKVEMAQYYYHHHHHHYHHHHHHRFFVPFYHHHHHHHFYHHHHHHYYYPY